MLCDTLEEWGGRVGGGPMSEGVCVYVQPIHTL